MTKKKQAAPVEETSAEVTAPVEETATPDESGVGQKAEAKPKKGEPITVAYRDHEGKPTERTFSKEDHGDNFAALAEEFKATNASKLI